MGARMQMGKAMNKFDREYWMLRKFCQQHNISMELRSRIKRYIDHVLVPSQSKISVGDLVLVPKLSPHLRLQLNSELFSQALSVHPFFSPCVGRESFCDGCNLLSNDRETESSSW